MDPLFYSPNGSSWNLQGPDVAIDSSKVVTMPVRKYTYQNTKYAILACADMSLPSDIFYMLSVSHPNGAEISSPQERDFRIVKKLMKYAPINVEQYEIAENKLVRKIANRKRQAFAESKNVQSELLESFKADMKDNKIKNKAMKTTDDSQLVHLFAADTKDDQTKETTNDSQLVHLFAADTKDDQTKETTNEPQLDQLFAADTKDDQTKETTDDSQLVHLFAADTKDDQTKETTNDSQLVHLFAADTKDDQTKETTNEPQLDQLFADDDIDGLCGIMGVYCRSGIHGDYRDTCAGDERKIA